MGQTVIYLECMKNFSAFEFKPISCRRELAELQKILQSGRALSESDDILPFFRKRQHLSASIGTLHPRIVRTDLIAYEYDIFGDFAADLVVGDSVTKAYCFIEFERADQNSIFVTKQGKNTPEWSPRIASLT